VRHRLRSRDSRGGSPRGGRRRRRLGGGAGRRSRSACAARHRARRRRAAAVSAGDVRRRSPRSKRSSISSGATASSPSWPASCVPAACASSRRRTRTIRSPLTDGRAIRFTGTSTHRRSWATRWRAAFPRSRCSARRSTTASSSRRSGTTQQRLPRRAAVQARLFAWKVLNRLPRGIGDALARLVLGQPLVPTEHDYRFSTATVADAPVLVAICRA